MSPIELGRDDQGDLNLYTYHRLCQGLIQKILCQGLIQKIK